ncbi:MAG: choice-of-anchor R domain-containing protein [Chthoniobacterales bacterium]
MNRFKIHRKKSMDSKLLSIVHRFATSTKMSHAFTWVVLGICLQYTPLVHADTLISTLGQSIDDNIDYSMNPFKYFATDFLTGSDASTVTSVTVTLKNDDMLSQSLIAEIWSDNAGSPDSRLKIFENVLTVPGDSSSYEDYMAMDTGISLAANTNYWLVLWFDPSMAPASPFQMALTETMGANPGGMFSEIADTEFKVSSDGGLNWSDGGASTPLYALGGVVPEPSAWALIGCGVIVTLGVRSWASNKTAKAIRKPLIRTAGSHFLLLTKS